MTGGDHDEAITRARQEGAERTGTPLAVLDLRDRSLGSLYGADLVLIRPDQRVAWRGDGWPEDDLLLHVTGRQAKTLADATADATTTWRTSP